MNRAALVFGAFLAALETGCQGLPAGSGPIGRSYDDAPFSSLLGGEPAGADEEPPSWPNSQDPGPDMANFPNSAFTIPRNAFQIELAPVALSGPTDDAGPNISTQYLLRFGLTDRLELRTFGLGYVAVFDGAQRTTGFAPFAFDLKLNLWDESPNRLIPAVGLEVFIQTEFGSPAFRSGTQPGIALLFDHTLPWDLNLEWNVGLNGAQAETNDNGDLNGPINVVDGPETNAYEWSLQWALQRRFFEKLDLFVQGYLNSSTIPSLGDGIAVGAGGIYKVTDRFSLFGSYNAGLDRDAPTTFFQLGVTQSF